MPELPEVETIAIYVRKHILHKRVESVTTWLPRMWRNMDSREAEELLTGCSFTRLERRGKYLLLYIDSGGLLVIHLRMTGSLVWHDQLDPETGPERFDRFAFYFTDGSALVYSDPRTLGGAWVYRRAAEADLKGLRQLGIEPLCRAFTGAVCYELLQKSSTPVKPFLLAQQYIAGIGNIYADEALFRSHIHPKRRASSLTEEEAASLQRAIRKVLREGIRNGGTTFRHYRNGEGGQGDNQNHLQVYGRAGRPCQRCGATLSAMKLGGRTTVYCPRCQPADGHQ